MYSNSKIDFLSSEINRLKSQLKGSANKGMYQT